MSETQSLEDLQPQRLEAFTRLLRPAQGLLISIGVIGGLVVLWEAGVRLLHVPEFILPAPSSIWQDTSALGLGILPHVGATLLTILGGYLIALIISLPLAVALFGSRLLSHAIYPLLIIKQSVPVVALAPILIVVLGAGEAPRIAITVIIALFPMVVSTATGLKSTPVELTELSSAMGASFWARHPAAQRGSVYFCGRENLDDARGRWRGGRRVRRGGARAWISDLHVDRLFPCLHRVRRHDRPVDYRPRFVSIDCVD
jgi:ABC-type anion transport system duplicated permease subunit